MDAQLPARPTRRPLTRGLLTLALATFALPFVTVTCYSEPVEVSGVQAATKLDLTPSHSSSEHEVNEYEPPNVFALLALLGAVGALALAFGRKPSSRQTTVWFAAAAVVALHAFFLYAYLRAWGQSIPAIGLAGAIVLLLLGAWSGVDAVPRSTLAACGAAVLLLVVGAAFPVETVMRIGWPFVGFIVGSYVSVALAIGAIRASLRGASVGDAGTRPVPRALGARMAGATIAGVALLGAAGVGAFFLMGAMLQEAYEPGDVGASLQFAILGTAMTVVASVLAWVVGTLIVHGRRRVVSPPEATRVAAPVG